MLNGSLQIKNNIFQIVYRDHTGKQRWKSTGIKIGVTKKDQEEHKAKAILFKIQFLKELEEKEERKKIFDRDPMSVREPFIDFIERWLNHSKDYVKKSTWETYDKVMHGQVIPYFKNKNLLLCDLNIDVFNSFFIHLRDHGKVNGKGGLSKKSVSNIRSYLISALDYAVEKNCFDENLIRKTRLPIFEDAKKFEYTIYEPDQIKRLLDYTKDQNKAVYIFLIILSITGCRRGEACGLTWDKINFQTGTITISQNKTGSRKDTLNELTSPKTKNGIRNICVPQKIINIFIEEKKRQDQNQKLLKNHYITGEHDFVVRKDDGSTYNPNSINRIVKRTMKELKLPIIRLHDFRHGVASMLFDMGVPLNEITTQLGHGQTSTTESIYIHKKRITDAKNTNMIVEAIGI